MFVIAGIPARFESGDPWTNGVREFRDWYTGEELGSWEDMNQQYNRTENENVVLRWFRCWDEEEETVSRAAAFYEERVKREAEDFPDEAAECMVNGSCAFARVSSRDYTTGEHINEINVFWLDKERDRVFNISYHCWEGDPTLTLDDLIALAESVTEVE